MRSRTLPRILAADYRRHVVYPWIAGMICVGAFIFLVAFAFDAFPIEAFQ